MEVGVALVDHVDVGVIAMAHKEQISVAQYRAFGSTGRAAGIKQPCPVGRCGFDWVQWRAPRQQRGIVAAPGCNDRRQGFDRLLERGKRTHERGRRDEQAGARIPGDMFDFARVQSGIDWNRAETRCPAREHHFEKFGAVLHAQHYAAAGLQTACDEAARKARDPAGELAIAPRVRGSC